MSITRRDFLKYTGSGTVVLVVGNKLGWLCANKAYAAVPALNFTITDAIKEMVTHNATNTAECYFWVFKEATLPHEVPGPTILGTQGDVVDITITNLLDEPHSFVIPGIFDSGPIAPVQQAPANVFTGQITLSQTGTFLYQDALNAPVNRVMGLHGALIVMPAAPVPGQKWTPYDNPTPQVQQLFNDLGTADHWPGLAWEGFDEATLTPPFRQYVWICHQASAALFREVGSLPPGVEMDPDVFVAQFTNDVFSNNAHDINAASDLPQYFTIGGQSGHFCHNNPVITPMARVGEPVVVRVLNAGLMTHSMHLHCNHYYVLSVDGVVQGTPVGTGADRATLLNPGVIWVDTFTLNPPRPGVNSSRYDLLIPYMRSPDVPNTGGIGRSGSGDEALIGVLTGQPIWPPAQEFDIFTVASTGNTNPAFHQRESPLCFPMHDHSEPSQTSQGGNYNTALISGMYIIGDRNITLPALRVNDLYANPGENVDMPALPPQTFPMDEDFAMMLGLDQTPQILVYGIDEARRNGFQGASKQTDLMSQDDRPDIPEFPRP